MHAMFYKMFMARIRIFFFFLNNELLWTENLGMQNALYPDDAR